MLMQRLAGIAYAAVGKIVPDSHNNGCRVEMGRENDGVLCSGLHQMFRQHAFIRHLR